MAKTAEARDVPSVCQAVAIRKSEGPGPDRKASESGPFYLERGSGGQVRTVPTNLAAELFPHPVARRRVGLAHVQRARAGQLSPREDRCRRSARERRPVVAERAAKHLFRVRLAHEQEMESAGEARLPVLRDLRLYVDEARGGFRDSGARLDRNVNAK